MTGRTPAGPEIQYLRPNRPREPAMELNADFAELETRALASAGISVEDFLNKTPWKKR